MYLVKYFHRPLGDDDRELLLIPSSEPMMIGTRMGGDVDTPTEDFLREQFSDIGGAVAAYRRHAAELVAAGYIETMHTRHTRRHPKPGPQPKLGWQRSLDDLVLAALGAPLEEQTRQVVALRNTRAAREPLYLWLAAHRGVAVADDIKGTVRLAEQARDTLAIRKAGRTPHYAWSIAEVDLEARIFEVLSWAHLRANDPTAALELIEQACRIAPSQDRSAQRACILRDHFPDRREPTFDAADRYAGRGSYEKITMLPGIRLARSVLRGG
jgi:hypothetical protein